MYIKKPTKGLTHWRGRSSREAFIVDVRNKLVSLGVLLLWASVACARDNSFAVDQVAIDVTGCKAVEAQQRQFSCHRIGPGRGYVIAERQYWPSKKTDDDAFEKLTMYFVSKPLPGSVFELPSEKVAVFFSSGPSSFPGKHGCYGAASGGRVEVTNISERSVGVKIDVSMDMKSPLGWQDECKQTRLRKQVDAKLIDFSELDFWHGKIASSYDLWSESHP
ncbi:hypothetical protein L2Y94_13410 [Luteibacter aegosomatis]|uniref:hypothetical protein n=1 Tax=Luteibacter aegosomatis TaxID=2911537 RepID=UPI001FFB8BA8|nr:hypothetical protein [Luteibacter aegosomatis]UPG87962.1 hypothetical protein L2Y94_13410 [Luteibacter aegosomatis]